jgi:phosphopantetheine adenylyltransferase
MYLYCNLKSSKKKTTEAKKEKLLEEKEYQMNLQHLQAQLEMAQEQRKSLNPTNVKEILKDYEQKLQCYTLVKMKNKMNDFEVEFEEWWDIAKEYFTKELENNLA